VTEGLVFVNNVLIWRYRNLASVFRIEKKNITNPKEWFKNAWGRELSEAEISETEDFYVFEDFSEELFMYSSTENWARIAGDNHLIFGCYSEDAMAAEFIEIQNGKCIREFRTYFDMPEDNADIGEIPIFSSWVDVASFVDLNLLN
jgi:hypothetical protein